MEKHLIIFLFKKFKAKKQNPDDPHKNKIKQRANQKCDFSEPSSLEFLSSLCIDVNVQQ